MIAEYDLVNDELTDEEFDRLSSEIYMIKKSEALRRKQQMDRGESFDYLQEIDELGVEDDYEDNYEEIPEWGVTLKKSLDTILEILERNPRILKQYQVKPKVPAIVRSGMMSKEAYNLFFGGE